VGEAFQRLQDDTWRVLDASQSIDQLHEQVSSARVPCSCTAHSHQMPAALSAGLVVHPEFLL
jgi:hypothetical protein